MDTAYKVTSELEDVMGYPQIAGQECYFENDPSMQIASLQAEMLRRLAKQYLAKLLAF